MTGVEVLKCFRCGYSWAKRFNRLPKNCPNPNCNSPYWNRPRKGERYPHFKPTDSMNNKTKLQKCWIWNKSVSDFVKEKTKGYSLNICAGKSVVGTVKMDLDPNDNSVLKGDMRKIPYPDDTFDTVIQDPPWKIGYYQRMKPFFECVRVCKVKGRIIYNAYWLPDSKYSEIKEVWIRQDDPWSNASIISIHEKVKSGG